MKIEKYNESKIEKFDIACLSTQEENDWNAVLQNSKDVTIFILTEESKVALNIARDLYKYYDIILLCLEENKKSIELLRNSIYKEKIKYSSNYSDYFDQLVDTDKDNINLIFPTHDFDIFKILNNHSIQAKCFIPDINKLKAILDKEKLYNIIKSCNIPFLKIFGKVSEIKYPIIIKEKKRENILFWKEFDSKYLLIDDKKKLKKAISKYGNLDNLIFQEYLPKTPKNEFSYIGYRYQDGRIIGKVVRKTHQIRQGGVTTFAEYFNSVRIKEYSRIILNKINYKGIFEIEFLYSRDKDDYFFIDFNARCCAWYNLLSGSGINLPLIFVNNMQNIMYYPRLFNKKKFLDLKSEIMNYVVYQNNLFVVIKRTLWLIKVILRENIVFAVYSKFDKKCNNYLIKNIIKMVCQYYYHTLYRKNLKKIAIKLDLYKYYKKLT